MFISKERIERELKDEDDWNALTPKEKRMFLLYCTNGFDGLKAYVEVYDPENRERVVKFPGSKAEAIVAKVEFENCLEIYGNLLKEMASSKINSQLFLYYCNLAFYNICDYVNERGEFRFESMEEAREVLGSKAVAIVGIHTELHPKDPSIEITKVSLFPREKAMRELQRFSKFMGEEMNGAVAMPNINIDLGDARFDPKMDEINAQRYKIDG